MDFAFVCRFDFVFDFFKFLFMIFHSDLTDLTIEALSGWVVAYVFICVVWLMLVDYSKKIAKAMNKKND